MDVVRHGSMELFGKCGIPHAGSLSNKADVLAVKEVKMSRLQLFLCLSCDDLHSGRSVETKPPPVLLRCCYIREVHHAIKKHFCLSMQLPSIAYQEERFPGAAFFVFGFEPVLPELPCCSAARLRQFEGRNLSWDSISSAVLRFPPKPEASFQPFPDSRR